MISPKVHKLVVHKLVTFGKFVYICRKTSVLCISHLFMELQFQGIILLIE